MVVCKIADPPVIDRSFSGPNNGAQPLPRLSHEATPPQMATIHKKRQQKSPNALFTFVVGFFLAMFIFYRSDGSGGNDAASFLHVPTLQQLQHQQQQQEQQQHSPNGGESNNGGLRTVREIRQSMRLPCNYVHDGYYIGEGNEMVNQVYESLQHLDEDDIPIVVECGGHDGITKSLSLKSSICLGVNTVLIEASPTNHALLSQTRSYDHVVHAALCNTDYVEMVENGRNSGQNHVSDAVTGNGRKVRCTSIDAELEKLTATVVDKSKLRFLFLVLDVEGHEMTAIQGIQKHSPHKVIMEVKFASDAEKELLHKWSVRHGLTDQNKCFAGNTCYNFSPVIDKLDSQVSRDLFYGARKNFPERTHVTARVHKSYYHMMGQ